MRKKYILISVAFIICSIFVIVCNILFQNDNKEKKKDSKIMLQNNNKYYVKFDNEMHLWTIFDNNNDIIFQTGDEEQLEQYKKNTDEFFVENVE